MGLNIPTVISYFDCITSAMYIIASTALINLSEDYQNETEKAMQS